MIKAYIDPSVMSYTIQIVAGAVITVGAVFAVVFRKAKKKAKNVLKIEDKKTTEEDIVDLSETAAEPEASEKTE